MSSATAAGGSISVDFVALGRTAAQIQGVLDELRAPRGSLSAMLDDPDITGALDRAESDWSKQRQRLVAFFEHAQAGVASSLDAYQRAEADIRSAANPSVPASEGGR